MIESNVRAFSDSDTDIGPNVVALIYVTREMLIEMGTR